MKKFIKPKFALTKTYSYQYDMTAEQSNLSESPQTSKLSPLQKVIFFTLGLGAAIMIFVLINLSNNLTEEKESQALHEYVSLIYRSLSLPVIDGYKGNHNDDDYSSASMYLSQLPKRSTTVSNGYAVSYSTDINTISKTNSHPEGMDKINYKRADINLKRAVKTRTLVKGSIAENSRTTSLDMKKDILGGVSFVKDTSNLESGKKIEMISEYPSNESAPETPNIPRYSMDIFSAEERIVLQNNMSHCKGGTLAATESMMLLQFPPMSCDWPVGSARKRTNTNIGLRKTFGRDFEIIEV
uniref:Uncharacterized protein n=1 Tax=Glossina pallidipes TaxID=7398 RepID=A0A1B0A2L2_GLOPL